MGVGGPRGWEGVCREFWGEGAKYFFFGAEIPTKLEIGLQFGIVE